MKITALFVKPDLTEWRLWRDISPALMLSMEADGWWVKATWTESPSIGSVFASLRASRIRI